MNPKTFPFEMCACELIATFGMDVSVSDVCNILTKHFHEREPFAWLVESSIHREIVFPEDLKCYSPLDGWTNTPLYK